MNNKIFISYRREDSSWSTGRIYDRLAKHFSEEQLFIDVDSIPPGDDFISFIEESVNNCDVLLAVIGPRWLESIQSRSAEVDFVRLEISAALKNNIRIVPILVEHTRMPAAEELPDELKELTRKNAFLISPVSFNSEMGTLVQSLQKFFFQKEATATEERQKKMEEEIRLKQFEEEKNQKLAETIISKYEEQRRQIEAEEQRKQQQFKNERLQQLLIKDFQDKQEVIKNLKRLMSEGGQGNFLILSIKNVYVQFVAKKGETLMQCETVSNEFLPKAYRLKNDQIEKVIALGFQLPDNSSNFFMEYQLEKESDFEQLSQIAGSVFFNIHKLPESTKISFKINLD